jgi:NAD+ synthase
MTTENCAKNFKSITKWIEKYSTDNNIVSLIVGISGGIDSALVSTLCASTGMRTLVVSLPIKQKENQLARARNHAKWLLSKFDNVEFIEKDLTGVFESFGNVFTEKEKTDLSLANSRSRIRMTTLYQISGVNSGIVVGTGNKIEDFGVGFFTKYGDGGVDISPIADLTKSEVRDISRYAGINLEILEAKPTDGLWEDDRSDEDQMGATYEELEWAMEFKGLLSDLKKRELEVLKIYHRLNSANRHKMDKIPVYKINSRRK